MDRDFDARIENSRILGFLFDALAAPAEQWLNHQPFFDLPNGPIQVGGQIEDFYLRYLESPFRSQVGGSRFNNLLWLNLIAHAMQPSIIVDSGTFLGASAWALSLGAPQCPIYSFDVDLSHLKLRALAVKYVQSDWMRVDFSSYDPSRGLCYFDDHIDQAKRLIEAGSRHIPTAIFDDDFPITAFAPMAHEGQALPKIEFVLDDRLREGAGDQMAR